MRQNGNDDSEWDISQSLKWLEKTTVNMTTIHWLVIKHEKTTIEGNKNCNYMKTLSEIRFSKFNLLLFVIWRLRFMALQS